MAQMMDGGPEGYCESDTKSSMYHYVSTSSACTTGTITTTGGGYIINPDGTISAPTPVAYPEHDYWETVPIGPAGEEDWSEVESNNSIVKTIDKTKLEVLEDILDDLEACDNTGGFIKVIAKIQKKIKRLKNEDK